MPVIDTGLYKVTLKQTFAGQIIFNTFFYEETLGRDDEQDVCATAFDDDMIPAIRLIQSVNLTYDEIMVDNVTGNLAAVAIAPLLTAGLVVGDNMNSFTAAGFRLVRTTKDTRNGSKRIAGMVEQALVGNGFTASFLADLQTFAPSLAANISDIGAIFKPVIARENVVIPVTWTVNEVAAGLASSIVTSQVSRKS